ncbi:MAG: hypothetical protein D6760_03940 [Deltaproteobacteria bacterium]|nr:MAG: hypothetical protein D6760_03940 [Deltaproteobacteria bacterium]
MAMPCDPAHAPRLEGIKLDHVAFGLASVDQSAEILVGRLGGRPYGGGPGIGFSGIQWQFARGELIEVIQPDEDPDGFLRRFLAGRGPGIHHVTFKVPRIEDAAERVGAFGYEVVGLSTANPGWKELFIHPRQAQGIVVQLAESHPELDFAPWSLDWPFPEVPPPIPEPAHIVPLRLSARDRERALRQWAGLLHAEVEETGDLLRFAWPGSPIRIAVEIDPDREEGPLGLEVRGAASPADPSDSTGPARPDGAFSGLGTRFFVVD